MHRLQTTLNIPAYDFKQKKLGLENIHLDLQPCDVANREAKNATEGHEEPEVGVHQLVEAEDHSQLPRYQHQRQK